MTTRPAPEALQYPPCSCRVRQSPLAAVVVGGAAGGASLVAVTSGQGNTEGTKGSGNSWGLSEVGY